MTVYSFAQTGESFASFQSVCVRVCAHSLIVIGFTMNMHSLSAVARGLVG